jgi:anaphase-promoting complex subunit 10
MPFHSPCVYHHRAHPCALSAGSRIINNASQPGRFPAPLPRACRSVKANILQLVVVTNHQNGRDTHLRQIRVFGPRADPLRALGHPLSFVTEEFHMYATVR